MDDWRYERKYRVDELDAQQVQAVIKRHPALFVQPYPPRFVNNIYLDSVDMESYFDNARGVDERVKVRLRWYGEAMGRVERPVLEFKIKRGLVGSKEQYPCAPFDLAPGFSCRDLQGRLLATLPQRVGLRVRDLEPVLLNRYYRWYYATRDGRFRITVDAQLAFARIGHWRNTFAHRQTDYRAIIVELKYAAAHEGQAGRVSSLFPFRVTKNSKYVEGIERVYP